MVGSASAALSGEALHRGDVPGMRFADGIPFAAARRVESGFFRLSGFVSVDPVCGAGAAENLRGEKNFPGVGKNYRFCLLGNNFSIIFAEINKLNFLYT